MLRSRRAARAAVVALVAPLIGPLMGIGPRLAVATLGSSFALGITACSSGGRARDVAGERRRRGDMDASVEGGADNAFPEAPRELAHPVAIGRRPRVFVQASSRALAVDATNLYYGNNEDDGVFSIPKAGGTPVRLARHAPVAGALALDGDSITWIASPGDVVLRISTSGGGQPTTLRDRGIFSDVASEKGDVFIAEAIGAGGALLRVTGPTAARLVSFEGSPRVLLVDATHAYVTTPTKVYRTPHTKGELETIATGIAFGSAEADEGFVYIVTEQDKARVVVRFPKTGGPMTVLARDVRDAPIEIIGDELLYFDASKPQLRAMRTSGGPSRVVAEDEAFSVVSAIEADANTVYVATGSRESAAILAVDRK